MSALGLLLIAESAWAQSSRIDGGSVSHSRENKFGFYWETRLEPSTPPLSDIFSTAIPGGPGIIHRILLDRSRQIYVGYDAVVRVLPEPNRYQVTFQRLTMTPELSRYIQFSKSILGDNPANFVQLSTPGWGLQTQEIRGGEVLELNLLVNSTTRQSVKDYVTVQEPSKVFAGFNNPVPDREFSFAPGPSRDFRVNDVELTIQSPRLSINGRLDASSLKRFDEVSGAVIWIYAAKRGRFILSLTPRPELGFRRAGEVRGSSLSFVVGSDTFTLSTGRRIAPGQAPFNLYVLHEPDWKPTYPDADLSVFNMGAADRPESLLRK